MHAKKYLVITFLELFLSFLNQPHTSFLILSGPYQLELDIMKIHPAAEKEKHAVDLTTPGEVGHGSSIMAVLWIVL